MPDFRRLALFLTIGSFSLAALMGVLALLSGGEFGEREVDVLLTTLLVGVTSIAVLCYLATADTPFRLVGIAGGLASVPTLGMGLLLVWTRIGDANESLSWKSFGIGSVASTSLAQVALLLVLAASAAPYVRGLLAGTLAAIAWVAVHVSTIILGADVSDMSVRLLGVVAILDVLGTVVVAALGKFGRRAAEGRVDRLVVPPDLALRVVERARTTGQRPDDVLRSALDAHLGASRSGP